MAATFSDLHGAGPVTDSPTALAPMTAGQPGTGTTSESSADLLRQYDEEDEDEDDDDEYVDLHAQHLAPDLAQHVGQLTAETLARLARSSGEVPRRPVEVDPARAASCPPGLEYLLALDGVVLKREQPSAQQLQQLRRQHNNHQHVLGSFHLYSPQGELLYFGHEEPDGCALCCCSASSWCGKHVCEMDIRLTDLTGRDVVLIQRDPGWATSCMPCCPVPTNFWFQQSATIINVVSGRVMGYIHQNYSPVGLSYSVYSVRKKHSIGKEMYRAHGWPGLAFLGCVPWSTPALQIRRVGGDADDGSNNIASINSVRQRAESTLVHVRNVNDVNVEFPSNVVTTEKMLLTALMILVEIAFKRTPSLSTKRGNYVDAPSLPSSNGPSSAHELGNDSVASLSDDHL